MGDKVLVTYASQSGSTGEIASLISEVLREAGLQVDQYPMSQVRVLTTYRAAVLGTAIRRGKPLPEAMHFVAEHRAALRHLRIACFTVGVYMREDTPENRAKTESFLEPFLAEIDQPVAVGYFAGKLDIRALSRFWRMLAPRDASGRRLNGDWRDWDKIQLWAKELGVLFSAQQ